LTASFFIAYGPGDANEEEKKSPRLHRRYPARTASPDEFGREIRSFCPALPQLILIDPKIAVKFP
jgi:hypothetical protein